MINTHTSGRLSDLIELYQYFSPKRKFQSKIFLVFILVAAIAEIFSIGIVIPFLGALMQPNSVFLSEWAQPILIALNVSTAEELPFIMTIIFILVISCASTIKLLHTWILVMLAHRIGADISQKAFLNTISLPYEELISKNSNDLISTLFVKINLVVIQIIAPCFSLLTSFILTIAILAALIFIEPLISLSISLSFGTLILFIITSLAYQA